MFILEDILVSSRVLASLIPFCILVPLLHSIFTSSYQNSILAYNRLNLCHLSPEFVKLPFYPYSPLTLKFLKNIILTFIIPLNCNKLLGYNLGCYNCKTREKSNFSEKLQNSKLME